MAVGVFRVVRASDLDDVSCAAKYRAVPIGVFVRGHLQRLPIHNELTENTAVMVSTNRPESKRLHLYVGLPLSLPACLG